MAPEATVRVVCVCTYYDENPDWLGQHMASLAPLCSDFVYVDGAYALFPGASERPSSGRDAAIALHEMAIATERSIAHFRPTRPFYGNEVEKRNVSLDLARSLPEVAGDRSVWFLVADADTVAVRVNDALPEYLARTDLNVAEYAYLPEPALPVGMAPVDRWDHVRAVEGARPVHIRSMYRNLPNLRYGPAHYKVTWREDGEDEADRRWLWGGNLHHKMERCLDITMDLRFEHRQQKRDPGRQRKSSTYYEIRDAAGIEHG